MIQYTIEQPDGKTVVVEASSPLKAAMRWAMEKHRGWWEALPWNGMSPKDQRYVDIFISPPTWKREFLVSWTVGTDDFHAVEAP